MKIEYHSLFVKHYTKRISPFHSLDEKFRARLELFLKNPGSPLLRDHALSGDLKGYRSFSITGDIRVIYFIQRDAVWLYDIGTHAQLYE